MKIFISSWTLFTDMIEILFNFESSCDFDHAQIKENNNTQKKTHGRCCNQFRGSLISQSFTQVLLKNDQLWLAVVLDHFYVTRATPLRFIGFLQSTLT